MPLARWRIDLSDEVDPPAPKRPRLNYWVHSRSCFTLHIAELLTILTPLVILKAVLEYRRPVITIDPNHPFHLMSRLMSSTYALVDFSHQNLGFFCPEAFE